MFFLLHFLLITKNIKSTQNDLYKANSKYDKPFFLIYLKKKIKIIFFLYTILHNLKLKNMQILILSKDSSNIIIKILNLIKLLFQIIFNY